MANKVSLNVKCTQCNHSFMDYKKQLNEKPSIKVKAKNKDGDEGFLWLCSTYGCYEKESEIELKDGSRLEVFCTDCGETLNTDVTCKTCDARMIKFNIEIGGVVSICDRIGCESHYVMIDDLTNTLRKFHREYGV